MIGRTRWPAFLAALVLVTAASTAAADAPDATPGRRSLGPDLALRIDAADRCPVCAMPVIAHARFAAAIQLLDGTTYYFCATGCMIKSWLHPEIFLGREKSALARPVVQEYLTGRPMDARDVIWVAGSDVIGPMGPYLTPLVEAHLETFRNRHGGKRTFRLADMDDDLWESITGKKAVPAR